MACSSPLSEPPSSPPRTPVHDRSHKRGSFDPSTPRTPRRLRSASREGMTEVVYPKTTSLPGGEVSKGKGKEVATPQTPKKNDKCANVISHTENVTGHISRYESGEMSRIANRKDQAYIRRSIKQMAIEHGLLDEHNTLLDSSSDEEDDDNLYEDASEAGEPSPTPGEKYAGPSTRGGQKTLREVDRSWTAFEAD